MREVLIDTNVVLRHLLADDPVQSSQAAALFREAAEERRILLLTEGVLVETVWVLTKVFQKEAAAVAAAIQELIRAGAIVAEKPEIFDDALERIAGTGQDAVDCLLAARAAADGLTVASFDKHLRRHRDVELWPQR